MKNFLKRIFLLVGISMLLGETVSALTPSQYCDPAVCAPATVKEMRPMAGGETFACISDDEKNIELYSYKTGKLTGVLFSINDINGDIKIDSFDGYSVSDDGQKLLIWNEKEGIYRHSFRAEYYVYDIRRKQLTRVSNFGPQNGAVLSHDGRMVAYQRDNNIYISNIDYGTDIAITKDGKVNSIIYGTSDWAYEEEFGVVNTLRWSDDDTVLAFMRFDESDVPAYSFDMYRSYCDNEPEKDLYPEAYTYKYPLAGFPNSVVSVLSYNINTRVTKTMDLPLDPSDYIPSLEFIPGSDDLAVMILNRDQNHLRLFRVNTASTVAKPIKEFRSQAWLAPESYQMVDYGVKSFIIGNDESGYRHLYEYGYDGVEIRRITSGEYNVTDYYGFDSKRKLHYVQTTLLGTINRNICSVDAKGTIIPLHNEEGWESAEFSSDYSYYLRCHSTARIPQQYTLWTAAGKKLQDVEMNKKYSEIYSNAPKMSFLKVKNAEGSEMNAYLIYPSGFDESKKYPLLMYQYGGPDSQEVQNRWRMEGIFYLASQGYVVAAVDGRGTNNRSRSWATAVYRQLGILETSDQIAGAEYFKSLSYIDPENCACFGWSYGGYMTLMELSAENTPFKCGVSMAPVTDWRFYDSIYTERYMQTPQQNEHGYEISSALCRADMMNRPLLIMSGTSDDNVHFYNTLKYTSKLYYEGKKYDMMALGGFDHSLRVCNARTRLFEKICEYLDKNLKY